MQTNDTRLEAQPLPTPAFDMGDDEAADWLTQLADVYPRGDRMNIMEFVSVLRQRAEAEAKTIRDAHQSRLDEIKAIEDDIVSSEQELEHLRSRLEAKR